MREIKVPTRQIARAIGLSKGLLSDGQDKRDILYCSFRIAI